MTITIQQLQTALDAALDETNQVAFLGRPKLAVVVPCSGRSDLVAFALNHMNGRLKAGPPPYTMVANSLELAIALGQGLPPANCLRPDVAAPASALAAAITRVAGEQSHTKHLTKPLRLMHRLYGITLPPAPAPADDRLLIGARFSEFAGRHHD